MGKSCYCRLTRRGTERRATLATGKDLGQMQRKPTWYVTEDKKNNLTI